LLFLSGEEFHPMEISKAAAGILAAACVTAGAGSAYLLTRHDPTPATEAAAVSAAAADAPVEQSEAVVGDTAVEIPLPSEPVPAPRPAAAAPSRTPARSIAREPRPAPAPARRVASTETPDEYVAPSVDPPPASEPRVATEPTFAPALPDPEPIAPAGPQLEDLVISADSVIGLEVESSVTSERARVEDEVVARVTRDVKVGDRVAIPAGARAIGEVTLVERGGKMRDKARLGVRFTSLVLADGTRIDIDTDTIIREGSSPTGESAAKIGGGAIGGAILGGILGGAKGAIIGGSAGAGAGTAAVLGGGRNPATLPNGAPITVRLLRPATVTVEK
jgi:type IV secretory pathway VirB10-like protein